MIILKANEIQFYFARLHIIGIITSKYDYLQNTFKKGKIYTKRNCEWGFFNINELENENLKIIFGQLVKFKEEKDEDIVDTVNRKLSKTMIENRVIATSIFFIHPDSGIVAYHPIEGKIGYKQFIEIFPQLIIYNNDNMFIEADMDFINSEISISEAIESFDKIFTLIISLKPSNPSSRSIWKRTDDKLHNMEAEYYKQIYKSKKGLILKPNGEPYGDIIMASDGYGRATLKGIKNNEEFIVSTDRMPMTAKTLEDKNPLIMFNNIKGKFYEVLKRIKNDKD